MLMYFTIHVNSETDLLIHEGAHYAEMIYVRQTKDNLELDNYEQDPEDEIESLVYVQRSIKRLPFLLRIRKQLQTGNIILQRDY